MKIATLPSVDVAPELHAELESVLRTGETLSEFVESSVRNAVKFRRARAEFEARGEAASQAYQRDGESHPVDQVVNELRDMLATRRQQLKGGVR